MGFSLACSPALGTAAGAPSYLVPVAPLQPQEVGPGERREEPPAPAEMRFSPAPGRTIYTCTGLPEIGGRDQPWGLPVCVGKWREHPKGCVLEAGPTGPETPNRLRREEPHPREGAGPVGLAQPCCALLLRRTASQAEIN